MKLEDELEDIDFSDMIDRRLNDRPSIITLIHISKSDISKEDFPEFCRELRRDVRIWFKIHDCLHLYPNLFVSSGTFSNRALYDKDQSSRINVYLDDLDISWVDENSAYFFDKFFDDIRESTSDVLSMFSDTDIDIPVNVIQIPNSVAYMPNKEVQWLHATVPGQICPLICPGMYGRMHIHISVCKSDILYARQIKKLITNFLHEQLLGTSIPVTYIKSADTTKITLYLWNLSVNWLTSHNLKAFENFKKHLVQIVNKKVGHNLTFNVIEEGNKISTKESHEWNWLPYDGFVIGFSPEIGRNMFREPSQQEIIDFDLLRRLHYKNLMTSPPRVALMPLKIPTVPLRGGVKYLE